MIRSVHTGRIVGVAVLLFVIFAGLATRLVFLQVFQHDKYRRIADGNTLSLTVREPRRGDIVDAAGNPLAVSLPVKKVVANPAYMGPHYVEIARELAPLLSYKEADLVQKLRPTLRTNESGQLVTNQFVDLKRKLSLEQWQQVTQAMVTLRL